MDKIMKEIWPGWETVELIGTGGYSKVYKIRKKDSGNTGDYVAALKIITIPQSPNEYETYALDGYDDNTITGIFTSQVKKIEEEFRLMSQFKGNSNIVSYEDHMIVPHTDGKGWDILIRMELLTSLPKRCNQAMLSEEEVAKLGIGICRALELCQKKNIIHRDIKPQNIFVNDFGDYKLGDFGIAKSMDHTTHATKTGTYNYMAPEVYRGEAYGSTIDIYSLGLVMYWLLNERRMPFLPLPPEAPTATQLNESQARRLEGEELPAPKNGSAELRRIVLKACAHNVGDRYATPTEMRLELERELLRIETAAKWYAEKTMEAAALINNSTDNEATVAVERGRETPKTVERVAKHERIANESDDRTVGLFHNPADSQVTKPISEPVKPVVKAETRNEPVKPPVKAETRNEPVKPPVKAAPRPEPVKLAVKVEHIPMSEPLPQPTPEIKKKTKKSTKGLLIAVLIVMVLSAVVLIWLKMGGDDILNGSGGSNHENPDNGANNHQHMTESDTWEYDATNHWFVCDCGESMEYANHSYGSWITTKEPTGSSTGIKERNCSVCGYKQSESIPTISVSLESISINSVPTKTTYNVGETLDTSGLTVTVHYSDGTTETIDHGFKCVPTSFTTAGTQTISVTYEGCTTAFTVTVLQNTAPSVSVSSISVKSKPNKTDYFVGDTFDSTGLTLTVTYDNGTSKTITGGFSCSPTSFTSSGTNTITVKYGGKTTSFTVNVSSVSVSSISVKSKPSKTDYFVGDTFDSTGLTLTVTYNNGTSKNVTGGFSCSPTSFTSAGTKTITVNYGGKTTSFTVNVSSVSVSSMSIKSKPTKTEYYLGDTLDCTGLALTVTYNNGTSKTVTDGYDYSPKTLNKSGSQYITVYYGGLSVTFIVNVQMPSVKLESYTGTYAFNCWDYTWVISKDAPYYIVSLPDVVTFPSNQNVNWYLASGDGYVDSNSLYMQQPGDYVVSAEFVYNGFTYCTQFTCSMSVYKTTTSANNMRKNPDINASVLDVVPGQYTIDMYEIAWDANRRAQGGDIRFYMWGKVYYNGKWGWIVIS